MSIFNKINKLYSDYTSKDIKVIASGNFVNSYRTELEEVPVAVKEAKINTSTVQSFSARGEDVDYYKLGLEYLRQKKYELAVEAFENALETKPDSVKARTQLGLAYLGLEKFDKALNELRRASMADPDNIELKFNLCTAYLKTDKADLAIKDLLSLLKADPENEKIKKKLSTAYYMSGNKHRKNNDFEAAFESFNKALKHDKTNPVVFHVLAVTCKDAGAQGKAVTNLDKAIKLYGTNPKYQSKKANAFIQLAEIRAENNEIEAAVDYYNNAINSDPSDASVHFQLAELYFKQKDYGSAQNKYLSAIKLDPEFIQAYINLGQTHVLLNNLEKAIMTYNKVLEIEKNNPIALSNLALITYKQGKKDLAYSQLTKIADDGGSDNHLVHKYLGIIQLEKGQIDDAIEKFMKSIDLNPNDADTFVNLGVCYHKMNNLRRAVKEYIKAVEIEPDNLVALKNLALLYYDADQITDAIELYERVLEIEPGNKSVAKTLAHAYRRVGSIEKAVGLYKVHLDTNPDDSEALLNVGVSYFEQDKLIKAIEIFNQLAGNDKSYIPMAYCYLSRIYQKNGQINKALEYIRKAVHTDTSYVDGFIQYGKVSLELGNIEKAIDCYKRVLKFEPKNKQAKIMLEGAKKKYEQQYGYSYDY